MYKWFVAKEKNLYLSLNFMKSGTSTYIGFFWAPDEERERVAEVMSNFPTTECKKYNDHTISPPTYIKTNDFTLPF